MVGEACWAYYTLGMVGWCIPLYIPYYALPGTPACSTSVLASVAGIAGPRAAQ